MARRNGGKGAIPGLRGLLVVRPLPPYQAERRFTEALLENYKCCSQSSHAMLLKQQSCIGC